MQEKRGEDKAGLSALTPAADLAVRVGGDLDGAGAPGQAVMQHQPAGQGRAGARQKLYRFQGAGGADQTGEGADHADAGAGLGLGRNLRDQTLVAGTAAEDGDLTLPAAQGAGNQRHAPRHAGGVDGEARRKVVRPVDDRIPAGDAGGGVRLGQTLGEGLDGDAGVQCVQAFRPRLDLHAADIPCREQHLALEIGQGDRIVVKVTRPKGRDFDGIQIGVNFSPTARLRVAVPRNTQLNASSGDGSIAVEDVNGKVVLHTSDGSVRATRVTGELSVRSGDGSIRLDAVEGKLDLETEDGSIGVEAKPTALRARTADGTIRLRVLADATMGEDWDVQTADGSVTLTLPSEFDGELDAETRDGAVRANHPAVTSESREGEDRSHAG